MVFEKSPVYLWLPHHIAARQNPAGPHALRTVKPTWVHFLISSVTRFEKSSYQVTSYGPLVWMYARDTVYLLGYGIPDIYKIFLSRVMWAKLLTITDNEITSVFHNNCTQVHQLHGGHEKSCMTLSTLYLGNYGTVI